MPTTKDEGIPEGTMKLLDRLIEKTIDKSKTVKLILTTMKNVTKTIEDLAHSVKTLARTAEIHQIALEELYARQSTKAPKESSLDLELPSTVVKEKTEKPN